MRRRRPCNVAKSPCIFPNCRERQVGSGLPAQPASRGYSGSLPAVTGRSRRSPEMRQQMAVVLSDQTQERQCPRENATVLPVYLYRPLRGSHLPRSGWSHHRLSIMMYIEVRIRCSQPASRGYSGSLPAVAGRSRISPEMRHQMAVVLSDPRQERQCRWGNATVLSAYLFRPLSGVTLAAEPMVPQSAKRHDSHPALSRTGYHERLLI